eukprot:1196332-Prorocentrum_minimum.AAC.1
MVVARHTHQSCMCRRTWLWLGIRTSRLYAGGPGCGSTYAPVVYVQEDLVVARHTRQTFMCRREDMVVARHTHQSCMCRRTWLWLDIRTSCVCAGGPGGPGCGSAYAPNVYVQEEGHGCGSTHAPVVYVQEDMVVAQHTHQSFMCRRTWLRPEFQCGSEANAFSSRPLLH